MAATEKARVSPGKQTQRTIQHSKTAAVVMNFIAENVCHRDPELDNLSSHISLLNILFPERFVGRTSCIKMRVATEYEILSIRWIKANIF